MDYIQLTDIVICLKNIPSEVLKFSLIDATIIINGQSKTIKVYKDNESRIYFHKGELMGFPYCRIYDSFKIYKNIKAKPLFRDKTRIILLGYGYNSYDSASKRQVSIEFILKYGLIKENKLRRELLLIGKGDERFIR